MLVVKIEPCNVTEGAHAARVRGNVSWITYDANYVNIYMSGKVTLTQAISEEGKARPNKIPQEKKHYNARSALGYVTSSHRHTLRANSLVTRSFLRT